MNFILNFLSIVLNKIFRGSQQKINSNTEKLQISTPNNAVADARASIVWICAICLAIYWIPQYLFADYIWIKLCLTHNALVPFPLNDQKLFDLLYSMLGLGIVGAIHKFIK